MRAGGGGAVGRRVGSAARFVGRCREKERPRAVEKKRGKGRHGWAASGPVREGEKRGWADSVGPKREEDEFFKIKSFSKSIFFISKPNSNRI